MELEEEDVVVAASEVVWAVDVAAGTLDEIVAGVAATDRDKNVDVE